MVRGSWWRKQEKADRAGHGAAEAGKFWEKKALVKSESPPLHPSSWKELLISGLSSCATTELFKCVNSAKVTRINGIATQLEPLMGDIPL